MVKKWTRGVKWLTTTIFVAVYVTVGLFNSAILRGGEGGQSGADNAQRIATVKTIVGYSLEFRLQEEMAMMDPIACDGGKAPPALDDGKLRWRHDKNLQMHVFSAYYDVRLHPYRYVRIIGLLPRNSSLYCQMLYKKKGKQTFVTRKAILHEIWSTNWGQHEEPCGDVYPTLISCPAPMEGEHKEEVPIRVSFVDKSCNPSQISVGIERPVKQNSTLPFIVCVKALNFTNHINDQSLVEWIELNVKFGASKIIVYVSNISRIDREILRYYEKKNVVEVRAFDQLETHCGPTTYSKNLWGKRKMEIIAYNDCFYRSIHDAKFVIPLDIDEIIVPKMGNNWYEAFDSHFGRDDIGSEREKDKWPKAVDEFSSFSVQNVYFFARYPRDAIIRTLMLPDGGRSVSERRKPVTALKRQQTLGPRDSIFNRIIRSSEFSPDSDSIKSFIHVPKTLSVFNHYAFHVLGEASRQYIFPKEVFQLNHYRNHCDPVLIDGCDKYLKDLTIDDALERFRNFVPVF